MALTPTVEKHDPNSCLNRALLHEPVFTMLARDAVAISAVEYWIRERIQSGKNKNNDVQMTEARRWVAHARQFNKELRTEKVKS